MKFKFVFFVVALMALTLFVACKKASDTAGPSRYSSEETFKQLKSSDKDEVEAIVQALEKIIDLADPSNPSNPSKKDDLDKAKKELEDLSSQSKFVNTSQSSFFSLMQKLIIEITEIGVDRLPLNMRDESMAYNGPYDNTYGVSVQNLTKDIVARIDKLSFDSVETKEKADSIKEIINDIGLWAYYVTAAVNEAHTPAKSMPNAPSVPESKAGYIAALKGFKTALESEFRIFSIMVISQ